MDGWMDRRREERMGGMVVYTHGLEYQHTHTHTICDMNKETKVTKCTITIASPTIPVKLQIRMTTEELVAGCRILADSPVGVTSQLFQK